MKILIVFFDILYFDLEKRLSRKIQKYKYFLFVKNNVIILMFLKILC